MICKTDAFKYDDLVKHYHGDLHLVDQLDYKLATLSSDFSNPRMFHFVYNGMVSLIPIVEYDNKIEIIGQFFGEGYRLPVCKLQWQKILETLKEETDKPLNIDYCGAQLPGMKESSMQSAVLTFSTSKMREEYRAMFVKSNDRRILRVVDEYDSRTQIRPFSRPTAADYDLLYKLSIERLGDESYFHRKGPKETFSNLSNWLVTQGLFQGMRYRIGDDDMGIAFFAIDDEAKTLYYLNGFFRNEYDGFGKYIYYSFVYLAQVFGLKEINALSPLYRIKKDMRYQPRSLYCL